MKTFSKEQGKQILELVEKGVSQGDIGRLLHTRKENIGWFIRGQIPHPTEYRRDVNKLKDILRISDKEARKMVSASPKYQERREKRKRAPRKPKKKTWKEQMDEAIEKHREDEDMDEEELLDAYGEENL